MATITVIDDTVHIDLTAAEKVAGLLRSQRIPLSAISAARVEPRPLEAVQGMRAPGLALPGSKKIGTWRASGGKQFVVARRGQGAVRIDATGQRWATYLVATDDADAVVAAIERERGR